MSTDLETVAPLPQPWTGGEWEELAASADQVQGADLEKGGQLIGIPMCLVKAVFRQGNYLQNGVTGWYVSLETIIGPPEEITRAIRRGRIPENVDISVEPGERLVFNEGGTGVYRQIVEYLEAKGLVRIDSPLPKTGKWGECRYDVLPTEWTLREDIAPEVLRIGPDGTRTMDFDIRLLCPRGLRQSKYENEYTKEGVTRYLG
jgi:hypothetical protein